MNTVLRLVFVPILAATALSASAVVINGGFESYNTAAASGSGTGYSTYGTGSTAIAGWTVTGVSVDVVNPPYMVHSGSAAVDLAGTPGPGGLSQTVGGLTSGANYLVSFYGYASGVSGTDADVVVNFGTATQTFRMTGSYALYSFIAPAGTSTTLSLSTQPTNTTNGNLIVDDVTVQATPEPSAFAALGLGAVAALRRRKRA